MSRPELGVFRILLGNTGIRIYLIGYQSIGKHGYETSIHRDTTIAIGKKHRLLW